MSSHPGPKTGHSVEPPNADEGRAAAIDALRLALVEGEQSGPSAPFDFDAFVARMRARSFGAS